MPPELATAAARTFGKSLDVQWPARRKLPLRSPVVRHWTSLHSEAGQAARLGREQGRERRGLPGALRASPSRGLVGQSDGATAKMVASLVVLTRVKANLRLYACLRSVQDYHTLDFMRAFRRAWLLVLDSESSLSTEGSSAARGVAGTRGHFTTKEASLLMCCSPREFRACPLVRSQRPWSLPPRCFSWVANENHQSSCCGKRIQLRRPHYTLLVPRRQAV